ncbi:lysylphosphatidylglycerol synthase domain-containing protein [candidate division KSB1 bacterium]
MVLKTKVNKTYNYILRLLIVILAYGFIYKQIFHRRDLDDVFEIIRSSISSLNFSLLLSLIFVLMILNWGIESGKWKFLISKIEKISMIKSMEAVLTGITISAFTPNRVGEYFGRVFILDKANPLKGILITIIGSISQFLVTVTLGSIGLLLFVISYQEFIMQFFFLNDKMFYWLYSGMIFVVISVDIFLLLFYFNVPFVTLYVNKLIRDNWTRIKGYISVLGEYRYSELLLVFLLSLIRYMIFTAQFILLLRLFSVNIPYLQAMIILSMIYFIITVIPTVALTELGIRGSVSLYFLGMYFDKFQVLTDQIKFGIVAASSALWLINLVLPALIGTIFVFKLKFFKKRS